MNFDSCAVNTAARERKTFTETADTAPYRLFQDWSLDTNNGCPKWKRVELATKKPPVSEGWQGEDKSHKKCLSMP